MKKIPQVENNRAGGGGGGGGEREGVQYAVTPLLFLYIEQRAKLIIFAAM